MTYFRYFQEMSNKRLLEELQKIGVSHLGNRETLLKLLDEYEFKRYEQQPLKHRDSIYFPRIFVSQEVQKRGVEIEENQPMADLVNTLKSKLNEEGRLSLLSLFICSDYKLDQVPVSFFIKSLENYRDLLSLSQEDISQVVHMGEYTEELWTFLMKNLKSLDFPDFFTAIRAFHLLHFGFDKKYSVKSSSVPCEVLEELVNQLAALIHKADIPQLAELMKCLNYFLPASPLENLEVIKNELFQKVISQDFKDPKITLEVIKNFPKDIYPKHKETVDKYVKGIKDTISDFWIADILQIFISLQEANYPVSFEFGMSLSLLPLDYTRTLPYDYLVKMYNSYRDLGILTEYQSRVILDSYFLFRINAKIPKDLKSCEKLIDLGYQTKKSGLLDYLLYEPSPFDKVNKHFSNLNTDYLMKFLIVFIQHLKSFEEASYLCAKLTNAAPNTFSFHLLLELQESLLAALEETPVFNYQLDSFDYTKKDSLISLSKIVYSLIQRQDPAHKMNFKYLSQINSQVTSQVFEVDFNKENIFWISKCAWVYRPGPEISEKILRVYLEAYPKESLNYDEGLYYILASGVDKSKLGPYEVNKESVYYLPICHEMNLEAEINEGVIQSLLNKQVFGEMLLKVLIVFFNKSLDEGVLKRLSTNLTYVPKSHPALDSELVNLFILAAEKRNAELDQSAYFEFIYRNRKKLDKAVQEVLKGKTQREGWLGYIKEKSFSFKHLNTRDQLAENSEDRLENNPSTFDLFRGDLNNESEFTKRLKNVLNESSSKQDLLKRISEILEHASLISCSYNIFDEVYLRIKDSGLIDSISKNDLVNLLFIYKYQNNNINRKEVKDLVMKTKAKLSVPSNPEKLLNNKSALLYYPAFKYNTEYETRYLISSLKDSNKPTDLYLNYDEISYEVFINNLKIMLLLKGYKASRNNNSDLDAVNRYFSFIKRQKLFKDAENKLLNIQPLAYELFKKSDSFSLIPQELKVFLKFIYVVSRHKAGIVLVEEKNFVKNAEKNTSSLVFPMRVLIQIFESSLGCKIHPICVEDLGSGKFAESAYCLSVLRKLA